MATTQKRVTSPKRTASVPSGPGTRHRTSDAEGDRGQDGDQAQVVEALLATSRVLVALAARSLGEQDVEVTLPQYRALVVLASRGPQRVVDISGELGVDPSTGTRLCDRLVRKGLLRRQRSSSDRRAVRLTLTPSGRSLVDGVIRRRRADLAAIVSAMPGRWEPGVAEALRAFAAAAGELPQEQWWMGWEVSDGDAEEERRPVPDPGAAIPRRCPPGSSGKASSAPTPRRRTTQS